LHGINQPPASRSIIGVSAAIACLARGQELYFCPTIKPHQNHAGFWGGVAWQSVAPHHSEHLYICRKGFHAKNVQVGCDSQLRFTNIAAKWPGSTHDSFMGQNSALSQGPLVYTNTWRCAESVKTVLINFNIFAMCNISSTNFTGNTDGHGARGSLQTAMPLHHGAV